MIRVRATKYDPAKRDAAGRFLGDEFISAYDVGRSFDGQVLTAAAYVRVEDGYVAAVRQLLHASGIGSLEIQNFEDHRGVARLDAEIERLRPTVWGNIDDGERVTGAQVENVVRLALREQLWCKLCGDAGVYVHFGYDYYMYLGSEVSGATLGSPPTGMFFENRESPH
jgi:hypothetical protein